MTAFCDLGINPAAQEALAAAGIEQPTAIQHKAIPALLGGGDAYLSSETGSGKTLAYLLPVLSRIDADQRVLQGMVIVPTHELAVQVCDVARDLARGAFPGIRVQALIGGVSFKRQVENLKKKPHLVVGTLGRIAELIQAKKVKPHTIKHLVIDEADRILFGDSLETIHRIIKATPRERQLVFVSATRRSESSREAEALSPDLLEIESNANTINPAIEHLFIECERRDRPDIVRKLIHAIDPERVIVFLHRNEDAEVVAAKLAHHKIAAVDLHGARDKSDRRQALQDFRKAKAPVLITSDLAARGLDVKGVSHVINFDLPSQSNDYLHRVGRTSRAGSSGTAISLITEHDHRLLRRYQDDLGIELRPGHLFEGGFHAGDRPDRRAR